MGYNKNSQALLRLETEQHYLFALSCLFGALGCSSKLNGETALVALAEVQALLFRKLARKIGNAITCESNASQGEADAIFLVWDAFGHPGADTDRFVALYCCERGSCRRYCYRLEEGSKGTSFVRQKPLKAIAFL